MSEHFSHSSVKLDQSIYLISIFYTKSNLIQNIKKKINKKTAQLIK